MGLNSPESGIPLAFHGELGSDVSLFCALWCGSSCATAKPPANVSAAATSTALEIFLILCTPVNDKVKAIRRQSLMTGLVSNFRRAPRSLL